MLATGGTLITIDMLKRAGARRIKGIFLVAAPEASKQSRPCIRRGDLHRGH